MKGNVIKEQKKDHGTNEWKKGNVIKEQKKCKNRKEYRRKVLV